MMRLTQASTTKPGRKQRWKRIVPFYLMVLPGFLYLLINNYIPMFGALLAFKRLNFAKGFFKSEWCGLENFKFLFLTSDAWEIARNTILYNVAFFIVGTLAAISLAILLNEVRRKVASKAYQTLILLPYLISWVVAGYLSYAFLSSETGFLNNTVLPLLGMQPIQWYQQQKYWPYILVIVNIWKNVGYNMIIYYSSIVGISKDYYEAARLDGASKWKQITHITLPLLKPTVVTLLILNVGQIFRSDFGLFYQIPKNSGVLYPVTRTIDVYVYQALMKNSDFGMSSAASLYQSVICFVLILVVNKIVRKHQRESALF